RSPAPCESGRDDPISTHDHRIRKAPVPLPASRNYTQLTNGSAAIRGGQPVVSQSNSRRRSSSSFEAACHPIGQHIRNSAAVHPGTRQTMVRIVILLLALVALPLGRGAEAQTRYVETAPGAGSFPLVGQGGAAARLLVDPADWPGVLRAVNDLQADVHR